MDGLTSAPYRLRDKAMKRAEGVAAESVRLAASRNVRILQIVLKLYGLTTRNSRL